MAKRNLRSKFNLPKKSRFVLGLQLTIKSTMFLRPGICLGKRKETHCPREYVYGVNSLLFGVKSLMEVVKKSQACKQSLGVAIVKA